MLVPPRPLRLRPRFVRDGRLRPLLLIAPALATLAVAALWQGRAAWDLAQDRAAWEAGAPVPVTAARPDVRVVQGLARHVRISATYVSADGTHRSVADDHWTMFTDAIGDGPLEIREDPESGRVALSWSMQAAPWRWGWIGFFGGVFLLMGGGLIYAARRGALDARVAAAAARSSDEVRLEVLGTQVHEVHGVPSWVEVRYRAPAVEDDEPGSYRANARPEDGPVRTARIALEHGGPLLVEDGTQVVALRPSRRSDRVLVLARDLWPLDAQPESADASRAGPASGMSTQAPSSSNT